MFFENLIWCSNYFDLNKTANYRYSNTLASDETKGYLVNICIHSVLGCGFIVTESSDCFVGIFDTTIN